MGKATWSDKPLPEDAAIAAAHPLKTGRHDLYAEAMRLVGARQTKDGLVELVNWLLSERDRADREGYERCAGFALRLAETGLRRLTTRGQSDALRELAEALRAEHVPAVRAPVATAAAAPSSATVPQSPLVPREPVVHWCAPSPDTEGREPTRGGT